MALESNVNYISDLNQFNPTDGDLVVDGDNHIRNIKKALKLSFPSITGPVTVDQNELNKLDGLTTSKAELQFLAGVTSAVQTQIDRLVPVGTIVPYAGNYVDPSTTPRPIGWAWCLGWAVPRTGDIYDRLFPIIGTRFGSGNGTTTFNLPDLRGLAIRGWDWSRGLDPNRVFGSFQDDGIQYHQHGGYTSQNGQHSHGSYTSWADLQGTATKISETWNAQGYTSGIFGKLGGYNASGTPQNTDFSNTGALSINASHNHTISPDGNHGHGITTDSQPGSTTETRMKNMSLHYIIKL